MSMAGAPVRPGRLAGSNGPMPGGDTDELRFLDQIDLSHEGDGYRSPLET
jgi:hypothetical protein